MTMKSDRKKRPTSHSPAGAQKTPNSGWFSKGRSGNPRGRPRRSARGPMISAIEILLDKTLTVTRGGKTCEISLKEALLQRLFKAALAGKSTAMRAVMKWIEKRREWFVRSAPPSRPIELKSWPKDPDNADEALVLLGIAAPNPDRADPGFDRAQLLLEPWAVRLALRRRLSLTDKDLDEIRRCTREADALLWPDGVRK